MNCLCIEHRRRLQLSRRGGLRDALPLPESHKSGRATWTAESISATDHYWAVESRETVAATSLSSLLKAETPLIASYDSVLCRSTDRVINVISV